LVNLSVGARDFSPFGEKQFGKIRDFSFFSGNSRKKIVNFFGKFASSTT